MKGIFLVFISGWLAWFWIDKPPPGQFGLPPASDSLVENFQRSINLLKAGYPDMAYLYIWHAHYLILSMVFGILIAIAFPFNFRPSGEEKHAQILLPAANAGHPRWERMYHRSVR